jgi:hypothetical protein
VVKNTLEANGFGWIPNDLWDPVPDWTKLPILHSRTEVGLLDDPFEPALASYEFRKLLRHLIGLGGAAVCDVDALAKKLSQSTAAVLESFAILDIAGLVRKESDCWVFSPTGDSPGPRVNSLGPTVERYVTSLLNNQLHWTAATNVYLQDTEYNDFDVVGVHGNEIAHVECKTSAPNQVSDDELGALAERHYFLEPAFTLLLVDTSSPIQDLANRLDQVLVGRVNSTGAGMAPAARFEPIDGSANVLNSWKNIYVGNANAGNSNGLLRTLRLTLRHYSTQVRGKGFYG